MKIRYIIFCILVLLAIITTPIAIANAYEQRGQLAFGGEYLLIPFAICLGLLVLELAKGLDELKRKIQEKENTTAICKENNYGKDQRRNKNAVRA